jgi:putative ABC transport system ATP-binding protein
VSRTERAAVQCEDLVKVYRTAASAVYALRGVTARFPKAALTAVAGPSGSGKSSLLRLIAGMDRPTEGTLVVEGVALHSGSSRTLRRLRRRTVGYVFQRASDNFFPHLTVREHLLVAVRASRAPARIAPSELLDLLGIGNRADHLPSELSGGEQARAALCQVLARGATIVVADEPTAELDSHSAEDVLRTIRVLVEHGATFILATHDRAIKRQADEVLELHHGTRRERVAPSSQVWRQGTPVRPAPEEWSFGTSGHQEGGKVVVEILGVSKSYRRGTEVVRAVQDANLTLHAGELVGLIGRSGSGKTTLLNIAGGWERPDEGHVVMVDVDPAESLPPWSDVSMVPQRLGLIDELTIRENIEYPARLSSRLEEVRWLVDGLIDSLGLDALQTRYPSETSVGEQQRAALARALVLSPRLILADEPIGHQDRGWADAVFEALRRAGEGGTTCLTATHDEDIVRYLDRILSMSDGRIEERSA